jgi:hypothetical protein
MDESILIEFERNGKVVPVTSFRSTRAEPHEKGIILGGETSAFPRGFAMNLRPRDAATKVAVERVQRRLDWFNPRRFEVEAARDGERLRLEGVDAEALPPGRYELKLRVGGMSLAPSSVDIRIRPDERRVVRMREKKPKRRLKLNRPVEDFDRISGRILKHEKSRLDGVDVVQWLTKAKNQDRRKAALMNILTKLAAVPEVNEPLNSLVEYVFLAEMDRIYCAVSEDFHELVKRTFDHDSVVHPTHKRLCTRMPVKDPENYDLLSYREKASSSLQAVVAAPKPGVTNRTHYVDLDIDQGNPGWDLKSFMIHVGELLDPRKTNHLKMRKTLAQGKTEDFVYYDVIKT